MRSVVVVLPASTWAMMPILRISERGIVRAISKFHEDFRARSAATPGQYSSGAAQSLDDHAVISPQRKLLRAPSLTRHHGACRRNIKGCAASASPAENPVTYLMAPRSAGR